jgi:membrane carboxypeptidase/penicillin-binding protein
VISGDLRRYAEIQRAGKQRCGRCRHLAEPQNGNVPPQPQLEQANQSLVAQSGAQEYAPHVINTPLSFLIKSALNSNIFGEPGWMGTGWRAATRCMTSAVKPGPPTARRMPGSQATVRAW